MKRMRFPVTLALAVLAARYCYHRFAPAPRVPTQGSAALGIHHLPTQAPPPAVAAAESLPGLSSDNPGERLQFVRQAQNKWGEHKPATTADQHAILGRWNHPWGDSAYLTFNADGTFTLVGVLRESEGTYRFLSFDQIELTFPGILYGENVVPLEYRLLADTLELKNLGAWVPYKRAALPPLRFIIGTHKEDAK